METYKLQFDIMDISSILLTFMNFGLKITDYYEITNVDVVEFITNSKNGIRNITILEKISKTILMNFTKIVVRHKYD
jgi:hypothetical protein